ncbi:glycosyltransferase family 1 protein [Patescibacteria group bacterium]|nr:MAG: glycosyltransferase family 1 protein [Patescibacteria group bacterium]
MRLLIVTQLFYPDTIGGSERVVYEHARALGGRGHEVTVVVQRARLELPEAEMIDGVRVFRYGSVNFRRWFGASLTDLFAGRRTLARLLNEEIFDAAILHHPFPAWAYFRARGRKIIPTLYFFHASVYRELVYERGRGRPISRSVLGVLAERLFAPLLLARVRWVERKVLRNSSRIAVLSDFSRRIISETFRAPENLIIKIPGGVDLETYRPHPNPRALRMRLNLPTDRAVILSVRRLVPRVGLEELLAAAEELLRRAPSLQLVVGGSGPERNRLVALARRLGISRSVTFLGTVAPRDLPDYYAAADLFVMPSVAFEGFGLATLEALAASTPVVGTPVGAIPEILNQLDRELVAVDATPAALAAAIQNFLDRPPVEREELRRRARELAESEYPWSRSVDLLENELTKLVRGD